MCQVQYQHDGSESEEDSFEFIALSDHTPPHPVPTSPHPIGSQHHDLRATFDIRIVLANDNEPRRVVDRPFHILTNGGRRVTLDDIMFTDDDVTYDSALLTYEWRDLVNARLVLAENRSVAVHRFDVHKHFPACTVFYWHCATSVVRSPKTSPNASHGCVMRLS